MSWEHVKQSTERFSQALVDLSRYWNPIVVSLCYWSERNIERPPRQYRRTKRGLVPVATRTEREWQNIHSARSRSRHKRKSV